jgi:type IV pilus assembly protein PilW
MRLGAGFTIIEFMIAMTLSLLVLAALTTAFVASSRSRAEIEKANEQIENGRFALQILTDDIEMAGFLSSFDIDLALAADTPLPVPAAKPNPCSAALADLRDAMPLHILGYDSLAALDSDLDDCLADLKPGTDILVVRRTATCVMNDPNCAPIAGAPYFQASLCETQLESLDASEYFRLDTTVGNLNRTQRNCATVADRRQYLVHIYFIANEDQAGDGIPTLKRAELGNAANAGGFTIVPLAHGIQDLQVDYGVDNDADGAPDTFTSDPDIYDAPGGAAGPHADCAAHASECISNWRNVMAVRLNVLARNSSVSRDHTDAKVYLLGRNDDGTDRCALDADDDGTCEAFGDAFKRHVYQTSVRLNNPSGRRES